MKTQYHTLNEIIFDKRYEVDVIYGGDYENDDEYFMIDTIEINAVNGDRNISPILKELIIMHLYSDDWDHHRECLQNMVDYELGVK
jgi:hypothetical protein